MIDELFFVLKAANRWKVSIGEKLVQIFITFLSYIMLYCAMLQSHYVMLIKWYASWFSCYVMLYYVVLCYVVLCYVMLWCVKLWQQYMRSVVLLFKIIDDGLMVCCVVVQYDGVWYGTWYISVSVKDGFKWFDMMRHEMYTMSYSIMFCDIISWLDMCYNGMPHIKQCRMITCHRATFCDVILLHTAHNNDEKWSRTVVRTFK